MNTKEFPFYIEKRLDKILNIMLHKLDKRDVWILIDGREGDGKTNLASYLMYWFSCHTKRKFSINNFYYDANSLREFAQTNYNEIINWDEAAIGGLSSQYFERSQLYLIQVGMTCRIRHHIIIMCIPEFQKLKDYFISRANCLIRVYVKNEKYGRYHVYSRKKLKMLYETYKRSRRLRYFKYRSFGGYCPEVFSKLFTEEQIKIYDRRKNEMITNIGKNPRTEMTKEKEEIKKLKYSLSMLKFPINTKQEFADKLGLDQSTIFLWKKFKDKDLKTSSNGGVSPF